MGLGRRVGSRGREGRGGEVAVYQRDQHRLDLGCLLLFLFLCVFVCVWGERH